MKDVYIPEVTIVPGSLPVEMQFPAELLEVLIGKVKLATLTAKAAKSGCRLIDTAQVVVQLRREYQTFKQEGWELLLETPACQVWALPKLEDLGVPNVLFLTIDIIPK